MEQYVLYVAGFGALALLTARLPMVVQALPLSLPICRVGIGALLSFAEAALVPQAGRGLLLFQHARDLSGGDRGGVKGASERRLHRSLLMRHISVAAPLTWTFRNSNSFHEILLRL